MDYEQQLTVVLAAMEHTGVAIDRNGVEQFGVYLSEQIEETQQMIYDEVGHEFNIGSPKQLGEVLFVEMQLPHGKKNQDRLFHQCRNLRKAARTISNRRRCPEMATIFKAEIHLCRRTSQSSRHRRQNPYGIQADRNPNGTHFLH